MILTLEQKQQQAFLEKELFFKQKLEEIESSNLSEKQQIQLESENQKAELQKKIEKLTVAKSAAVLEAKLAHQEL